MTARTLAVAAALAVSAAFLSFGQDASDAGAFDSSSFDQAVTHAAQPGQAAKTEFLYGGSFLTDNAATTSTTLDWYTLAGSVSGKVFGKLTVPDYGSLYVGYNVSKNMYQGDGGTLPAASIAYLPAPAGSFYAPSFTLSELYYSFDVGKALFVRLGNQLITWGPSAIWTPVDFINLQRVDPLATIDLRVGRAGIRLTVPLPGQQHFPFHRLLRHGDLRRRAGPAENGRALRPMGRDGLPSAELALTGWWGERCRTSTALTSRAGSGLRHLRRGCRGFPLRLLRSRVGRRQPASGGRFGDLSCWSIAGEFFYNSAGTADTSQYPAMLLAQTFVPLYVGQYYAYASLSRSHLGIDGISASLAGFANLSDMSYLVHGSLSVAVPNLVPFSFGVSYAGGGNGKEFTLLAGDGTLSLDLQVRLDLLRTGVTSLPLPRALFRRCASFRTMPRQAILCRRFSAPPHRTEDDSMRFVKKEDFLDVRILDNFYQTSSFFPMPVVLVCTIAETGQMNLGPYSLCFPYSVPGERCQMVFNCRDNSNTGVECRAVQFLHAQFHPRRSPLHAQLRDAGLSGRNDG